MTGYLARAAGACGRILCLALLTILAAVATAGAQIPVNCNSNSAALHTISNAGFAAGQTYELEGTCVGSIQITLTSSSVTIEDGEIQGTVSINGSFVTLSNLTIDGTGATSDAMIIDDARAVTLNNVIVQNFTPDLGIVLSNGATVPINGS
jgi:hypothetical protein